MELPGAYISHPNAGTTGAPGAVERVDLTQWWRFLAGSSTRLACRTGNRGQSGYRDRGFATATGTCSGTRRDRRGPAERRLGAGAGFGTGTDNTRGRVSEPLHSACNTTGFSHVDEAGSVDTAWELDVFGKLRREIEASHLDALAAAKARDAVLVSVIANVARAYIEVRGFQEQIAITAGA
jgi:hypothetical protein